VLGELGRSADALAAYQQVIDRYGDDPAPALREQVAKALLNTGVELGVLGRPADAVAAYQQVINRYGDDPAPALREAVARATAALQEAGDGGI
jgi:TolA-binding protein